MNNALAMGVVVGILALIMVGAFLVVWLRDRNRSQEVSGDVQRFGADPESRHERPER